MFHRFVIKKINPPDIQHPHKASKVVHSFLLSLACSCKFFSISSSTIHFIKQMEKYKQSAQQSTLNLAQVVFKKALKCFVFSHKFYFFTVFDAHFRAFYDFCVLCVLLVWIFLSLKCMEHIVSLFIVC